jgi:hypothetical protein
MLTNEQRDELLAKSPSPRRITPEYMESRIASRDFMKIGETGTLCILTLDNNYQVRGYSACVDPANYRQDLGEKIAYDDAFRQLWPLFGFLLAEQWHIEKTLRARGEI